MDKINFVNNSAPALSAENLNQIQTNIDNAKLDKTGGTVTGTLNTRSLVPTANNVYDLGSMENQFGQVFASGIRFDGGNSISMRWNNGKLQFFVDGTLVKEL